MTASAPSPLVPKLRFAEFKEEPGWDEMPLSAASDVNPSSDGLPDSFIYIDLESVKDGALVERKEIARDAAPSRAQRLLSRKDMIYQTVRPYQRNNLFFDIDDGFEYVASTGYAQLRAHACPEFLYQLLHTDWFVNSVLAQCTGSNYPAINSSTLACVHVVLPPALAEQQKIAECLGSLDDLIAAEGRRLAALRRHKQGLMQQLFPQPGETVPRLRFPEFREAGDWGFQPLCSVADPITEKVGTTKCVPMSVTTGVGLVSQEDKFGRIIAGDSYKNYIKLRMNDFAYNKSATKEYPQGYIARYTGTRDAGVPNSIFTCFRSDADAVIPEYLDHLFHGNHHGRWLRKYITVGARAHGALSVSDDDLFDMPVPFPPAKVSRAEQQKIADCLGSLDDLIAGEGRKLDALRQHKQGLLHQLFPAPEEEAR